MRHLPIIVLLLIMPVLPSCKYFKSNRLFGRKSNTEALLKAKQDSTRVSDSIKEVQEQLTALENEKLAAARKADDELLAHQNKYKYNIIIGSFVTPQYANDFAQLYRTKGYDTKIIKPEGTRFHLVSAAAYEHFGAAASRLKEFQDTIELQSWMYIKK
jgi:hypothetical protein